MNKRHICWAGVCVAAAAAIAGCGRAAVQADTAAEPAPVAVEVEKATVGPIRDSIMAQGLFVSSQGSSAKVAPMVTGRLLKVFVKEGDIVKAGQLVGIVDTRVQQSQAISAQAAARAAQATSDQTTLAAQVAQTDQAASVKSAQIALGVALSEYATSVKQATYDVQTARAGLDRLQVGNRPEEIAQADEAARQAKATRDQAQRDYDRAAGLVAKGYVSGKDFESARTALGIAESALRSADNQAKLMHNGSRQEDLRAGELRLQTANEALRSAKDVGSQKVLLARTTLQQANAAALNVEAKRAEARAASITVAQKMADASAAQQTVATGEIHSPIDGRVAHRFMNPGDLADPTQTIPVMEIANTTATIDFVANVTPDQAIRTRVGQTAQIAAPTGPEPIDGVVINVGQADVLTGLLPVRIHVVKPPATLRAGLAAPVQIVVQVHPKAVSVSKECVLDRDGKSIVFLSDGDTAKQAEVEVGASDGDRVEIVKGLKAGQSVIKLGQYEIADGAKTKIAQPADEAKPPAEGDKAAAPADQPAGEPKK